MWHYFSPLMALYVLTQGCPTSKWDTEQAAHSPGACRTAPDLSRGTIGTHPPLHHPSTPALFPSAPHGPAYCATQEAPCCTVLAYCAVLNGVPRIPPEAVSCMLPLSHPPAVGSRNWRREGEPGDSGSSSHWSSDREQCPNWDLHVKPSRATSRSWATSWSALP